MAFNPTNRPQRPLPGMMALPPPRFIVPPQAAPHAPQPAPSPPPKPAGAPESSPSSEEPERKMTREEKWEVMFGRLVNYKKEHGDCLVPYRCGKDPQLGKWVNSQRLLQDQGCLAPDRVRRLASIGFAWRVKQKLLWDEMFDRLVEYKQKHGDCLVPQRYKQDPKLGRWVDTQRENKDRRLTPEHRARLESIGFVWCANKESWDGMFDRLVEYKARHGDCRVPQRYEEDPKLGKWVKNQRLRRDCLSDERVDRLEAIGFEWSVQRKQLCIQRKQQKEMWDAMYKRLMLFKARYGNCLVPANYKEDPALASWVSTQRKKKEGLSTQRLKRLESIGFEWNVLPPKQDEEAWEGMFQRLVEHKATKGTCVIPKFHKDYPTLGVWIEMQREIRALGGLTPAQVAKLDSIGFVWDTRKDQASLARAEMAHGQNAMRNMALASYLQGRAPGAIPPAAPFMAAGFPDNRVARASRLGLTNVPGAAGMAPLDTLVAGSMPPAFLNPLLGRESLALPRGAALGEDAALLQNLSNKRSFGEVQQDAAMLQRLAKKPRRSEQDAMFQRMAASKQASAGQLGQQEALLQQMAASKQHMALPAWYSNPQAAASLANDIAREEMRKTMQNPLGPPLQGARGHGYPFAGR